MKRVEYLEGREKALAPPIKPNYHRSDSNPGNVSCQRMVCVDRIFRLGVVSGALDTTCFAAVRLFDRCMSVARLPIAKTNMLLLAIASFDIVHKASDSDILQPNMKTYYCEGFSKGPNDYTLPFEKFGAKLKETEVVVLNAVAGEPVVPTAQEYMAECCPNWYNGNMVHSLDGRRASLLCSAFLYSTQSTVYSAEHIAAAAACFATGGNPMPTEDMNRLCRKLDEDAALHVGREMVRYVEKLFSIGKDCSLYYMYYDIYSMQGDEIKCV